MRVPRKHEVWVHCLEYYKMQHHLLLDTFLNKLQQGVITSVGGNVG